MTVPPDVATDGLTAIAALTLWRRRGRSGDV